MVQAVGLEADTAIVFTARIRLSALTGVLLALISVRAVAFTSLATARPRHTEIVRDGVYGSAGPHNTSVLFYVRGRRVYHLRFVITIPCRDPSGPIGDRYFTAGSHMPQGQTIPRSGRWIRNWHQNGDGRPGVINADLDFAHGRANFQVVVAHAGLESCDGSMRFHIRHGPRILPVPPGP